MNAQIGSDRGYSQVDRMLYQAMQNIAHNDQLQHVVEHSLIAISASFHLLQVLLFCCLQELLSLVDLIALIDCLKDLLIIDCALFLVISRVFNYI